MLLRIFQDPEKDTQNVLKKISGLAIPKNPWDPSTASSAERLVPPQYATLRKRGLFSASRQTSVGHLAAGQAEHSSGSSSSASTDDDVTTVKAKSGSLASLSSKASSTLSRMMSVRTARRRASNTNELTQKFPGFYVSQQQPLSTPATPMLPFSKRRHHFQSQFDVGSEGKANTMTAVERAKLVMRMRGGGGGGVPTTKTTPAYNNELGGKNSAVIKSTLHFGQKLVDDINHLFNNQFGHFIGYVQMNCQANIGACKHL